MIFHLSSLLQAGSPLYLVGRDEKQHSFGAQMAWVLSPMGALTLAVHMPSSLVSLSHHFLSCKWETTPASKGCIGEFNEKDGDKKRSDMVARSDS